MMKILTPIIVALALSTSGARAEPTYMLCKGTWMSGGIDKGSETLPIVINTDTKEMTVSVWDQMRFNETDDKIQFRLVINPDKPAPVYGDLNRVTGEIFVFDLHRNAGFFGDCKRTQKLPEPDGQGVAVTLPISGNVNNPEYWRKRAEDARTTAEKTTDPEVKERLLRNAEEYDWLANLAEKR